LLNPALGCDFGVRSASEFNGGGVIAIISFRAGGWMQRSTVPRCAILSVGSTGVTSSGAARVHIAYRRCGGSPFAVVDQVPVV